MRATAWPLLTLLFGFLATLGAATAPEDLSLALLEKRLHEIDGRLAKLANYNLGTGIGAIGSRSAAYETADQSEWIEIEWAKAVPLDQVMLVPAIRRDGFNGFQADGFPQALRLRVGTADDRTGKIVAEYFDRDNLLPRIAPLVIPCHGVVASWIRIETSVLSRREFDSKFVFQFSEVLAFSGEENVALHQTVKFPSNHESDMAPGWPDSAIVDGFLPYLMASPSGGKSVAYLGSPEAGDRPTLTIDLGKNYPLSRLHLHTVDQSDTVPQAFTGDIGIPQVLRVEGAQAPDFSDAQLLTELHHETLYDVGPVLMRAFPVVHCRYIRLVALKPNNDQIYGQLPARMGFAEIELFSNGHNVALNQPVTASFTTEDPVRNLSSLTDGRNFYGTILPIRKWLIQLARRHELEGERPLVSAELTRRYLQQKANVTQLSGLAVVLAFGVIVIILINRSRQQRAITQTRKRIAADLHDELGADLHALGLLSDLAYSARTTPNKLEDFLQRIRSLTERTGKAARHCTNLLEAEDLHKDLVNDMRHTSDRILADLEHHIEFEGEALLRQLSPRKHLDLLLFYQESLINIIRHSGATQVHTRLTSANGQIELTVADNGRGLDGRIPSSLKRRARLLGADVSAGPAGSRGTLIVLRLKKRWFNFLK